GEPRPLPLRRRSRRRCRPGADLPHRDRPRSAHHDDAGAVLVTIGCLKIFTEVHLLSNGTGGIGGESQTLTMYIRAVGLDPTYGSLGMGSAGAVALFVMTIGFLIASQRLNASSEN